MLAWDKICGRKNKAGFLFFFFLFCFVLFFFLFFLTLNNVKLELLALEIDRFGLFFYSGPDLG